MGCQQCEPGSFKRNSAEDAGVDVAARWLGEVFKKGFVCRKAGWCKVFCLFESNPFWEKHGKPIPVDKYFWKGSKPPTIENNINQKGSKTDKTHPIVLPRVNEAKTLNSDRVEPAISFEPSWECLKISDPVVV